MEKLKSYTPEQIKLNIRPLNTFKCIKKGGGVMVEYKEDLDEKKEVSLIDNYYQNFS